MSSLRWAVHAAAPCPVPVKRAMIDWWGPILFEFYSMTEGFGAASIFSDDWLRKPGSVGRPLMGVPHIAGPDGTELPAGEIGTIWFEGGSPSEYHDDPGSGERGDAPRRRRHPDDRGAGLDAARVDVEGLIGRDGNPVATEPAPQGLDLALRDDPHRRGHPLPAHDPPVILEPRAALCGQGHACHAPA